MTLTVEPDLEMEFLLSEHALGKPLDFERVVAVLEGMQAELEGVREHLKEREDFVKGLEEEIRDADAKGREERDDLENSLSDAKQTVREAVASLKDHIQQRTYTRDNLETVISELEVLL